MASFGRISIEVKKGSELVAMNPGKTANPFVRISAGKNSFDTEVVEKTVNPSFEKGKHVFPPCPLPTILTINLFNKLIYLEEDEPMGTATVTIFSAGPETTKTVFLTHGGNVKLAAKARGGCGTLELVYTVTPCDSLDDGPSSVPEAAATTALSLSSSVPDFLKDAGGAGAPHPAAIKPTADDPFEDMFGEKSKPDEIPTPLAVSTPTPPTPQPEVPVAAFVSTPDAPPPVAQYTSPPAAPEPPAATVDTTTTKVVAESLPSTPAVATPATPEPPGPLGQTVQTSTTAAAAAAPLVTTQPSSSSTIGTPTSVSGDTKQFSPPPPLPAEPVVSAVNTTKQVTFDGKSLKNLAINKRRSPSAGATRAEPKAATSTSVANNTVRSTSASRTAVSARGSSASTNTRKTFSGNTPSATPALHNSHTAASSARVNPSSVSALTAASTSAYHHNGGPITSAQHLQHTNPHVAFLYSGENAKSLLAAAISGSQKEFNQVKELDPLLMNGFLAVKDYSGRNALHLAAWHGNPAVIDQLLNGRNTSGVAPRIDMSSMTTNSGNTLLHCAALGGDPRTVEWLMFQPSCQSLISVSNKRGLTPYQAALEAGNTDCAAAIQIVTSRGGVGAM